jgi:hypothetical protein
MDNYMLFEIFANLLQDINVITLSVVLSQNKLECFPPVGINSLELLRDGKLRAYPCGKSSTLVGFCTCKVQTL